MSYVTLITINCDMQDHASGCSWWIGNERSRSDARALARAAGWTRVAGMDLSPVCRAKYEGKECPHAWSTVSVDNSKGEVREVCVHCTTERIREL